MSDAAQPEKKPSTSTLAVWALVLSIIPCTALLGLLLGVVALLRFKTRPHLRGKGVAIAAIVVPLVMGPITAMFAVPEYVRFACRAKQSEAKVNLKSLHASQMSHRLERSAYGADLAAVGFAPGGDTVRYTYRVLRAGADTYEAEAVATEPTLGGDRWFVNENGEPMNALDGCR